MKIVIKYHPLLINRNFFYLEHNNKQIHNISLIFYELGIKLENFREFFNLYENLNNDDYRFCCNEYHGEIHDIIFYFNLKHNQKILEFFEPYLIMKQMSS